MLVGAGCTTLVTPSSSVTPASSVTLIPAQTEGQAPTSASPAPATATLGDTTLPIDPTIVPVSRSAPSTAAQHAFDVCDLEMIGFDKVAGMGLIASASRAREYAPLTGLEPELKSDEPAWMIQFAGDVDQPLAGEVWQDPICVVIKGRAGFYATGPVRLRSGALVTPLPVPVPPTFSLPPLAP